MYQILDSSSMDAQLPECLFYCKYSIGLIRYQTFVRIYCKKPLTPNVRSYILRLQPIRTHIRGDEMNQTLRRRRRRQENNIKFIVGIIVVAIFLIFLMNVVLASNNVQGEVDISDKGYITITVHAKDTLWSIAEDYMNDDFYTFETFIAEVSDMNNLDHAEIFAGEQILVPVIASNN